MTAMVFMNAGFKTDICVPLIFDRELQLFFVICFPLYTTKMFVFSV